jgi:hypothetical protein
MAKVLGIGGVFFRSEDPEALGDWYARWLGVPVEHPWGASFQPSDLPEKAFGVWAPFKKDTDYFAPETSFTFNLVVDDLDGAPSPRSGRAERRRPKRSKRWSTAGLRTGREPGRRLRTGVASCTLEVRR